MRDSLRAIVDTVKSQRRMAARLILGTLLITGLVLAGVFAHISNAYAQAEATATEPATSTQTPTSTQSLAWQALQPLDIDFLSSADIALQDGLHIVGETTQNTLTHLLFDPTAKDWVTLAPPPAWNSSDRLIDGGGQLWLFSVQGLVAIYDVQTDQWTEVDQAFPVPVRADTAIGVHSWLVYFFGTGDNVTGVSEWNIDTNDISSLATLNAPLTGALALTYQADFLLLGETADGKLAINSFDPGTNTI